MYLDLSYLIVHRHRTKIIDLYLKNLIVQEEEEVSPWLGTAGSGVCHWLV